MFPVAVILPRVSKLPDPCVISPLTLRFPVIVELSLVNELPDVTKSPLIVADPPTYKSSISRSPLSVMLPKTSRLPPMLVLPLILASPVIVVLPLTNKLSPSSV